MSGMRIERLWVPTVVFAVAWASPAQGFGPGPAPVAAPVAAPKPGTPVASIIVTNPLPAARGKETIALTRAEIARLAPTADFKGLVIADAGGRPVLSQLVDMDGDDEPDELVFQTDLAAKQAKTFKLRVGPRTPPVRGDFLVYGRFVRERLDDFAWENDLVAHRMYGPALETAAKEPLVSSGIDAWVKRVKRLVVNDWYMTGDYHRDLGEGADFYGVGKSRGCGGLGLWAGGKLSASRNFVSSRVLANGPIRLVFELRYAPWEAAPGIHVAETKRVVLDAGTPFNRFESTFTGLGSAKLGAGIGIAKHAGSAVTVDAGSASMRAWEPLKDGKGDANGNLGCAIVLPPGSPLEEHHDELDYVVVTPLPATGKLVYHLGSAWDRGSKIRDAAAWGREVQGLAARTAAPVQVSLSAPGASPK
jgi:unsaturated rhamnogalacturonyl hydrolase